MKIIKICLLLIFFNSGSFFVFAANYLEKTVILKVKPQFASICTDFKIKNQDFNNYLSSLDALEFRRKFPTKRISQAERFNLSLIYEMKYNVDKPLEKVMKTISKFQFIEYAEPSVIYEYHFKPNDPYLSRQYTLQMTNAFAAFDITKGDTNVLLGIVDAGFRSNHPDIIGKIKHNYADIIDGIDNDNDGYVDNYSGWDVVNNDNDPDHSNPRVMHGLAVSSIAVAATNNGVGMSSVGFNTKFIPINIADSNGYLVSPYVGVVYAADYGCDFINCSWGAYDSRKYALDIIDYVVNYKNKIMVAATGNSHSSLVNMPAVHPDVLAVFSVDRDTSVSAFSDLSHVADIATPGNGVYLANKNSYITSEGTSHSAGLMTGALGLIKSHYKNYTNEEIVEVAKSTAYNLSTHVKNASRNSNDLGYGMLDLKKAIVDGPSFNWASIRKIEVKDKGLIFKQGDTIKINVRIKNYFNQENQIKLNISSSNFQASDGSYNIVNIGSLKREINNVAKNQIRDLKFKLYVQRLSNDIIDTNIDIGFVILGGGYSSHRATRLVLSNRYKLVTTGLLSTYITPYGSLGLNQNKENLRHFGLLYNGRELIDEAGLYFINDKGTISHKGFYRNKPGTNKIINTFKSLGNPTEIINSKVPSLKTYTMYLLGISDADTQVVDNRFLIKQTVFVDTSKENNHCILMNFKLMNKSNSIVDNLAFGYLIDWSLKNNKSLGEKIKYDALDSFSYTFFREDSLSVALVPLTSSALSYAGSFTYSKDTLNIPDEGINEKLYLIARYKKDSTDSTVLHDAFQSSGVRIASLHPSSIIDFSLAIVVGKNKNSLKKNVISARNYLKKNKLFINKKINQEIELTLFPNPFKEEVFIRTNHEIDALEIYDMMGKKIENRIFNKKNKKVSLSRLASGSYIFKIFIKKAVVLRTLIKE